MTQSPYFWALLAVGLWSTVATAFKIALDFVGPVELLLYSTTASALTLFLVALVRGKLGECKQQLFKAPLYYLAVGLLNPIIYYLTLFAAYDRLPGSQAQPINYTWAISLTVMSALFLKQKIRRIDWLAGALGYFGVLLIATRGDLINFEFTSTSGVLLALLSTFLWAGYWIANARNKAEPTVALTLSFGWATLLLWALVPWFIELTPMRPEILLAVSYIGLFEMGITFLFWATAMRLASNTALVANLIFLSPFLSLILLYYIRGETIYPATIIGLVVIVAALLLQRRKTR